MNYADFVSRKLSLIPPTGLDSVPPLPDYLFDHQRALVTWALRRGRYAIFADTGLGKTRMELAYAQALQRDALILAPLAAGRCRTDRARRCRLESRIASAIGAHHLSASQQRE